MNQFWMVWNYWGFQPLVKHPTEEAAIKEAERLASVNQGLTYIVLEATHARRSDSMKRADLRRSPTPEDDDMPF